MAVHRTTLEVSHVFVKEHLVAVVLVSGSRTSPACMVRWTRLRCVETSHGPSLAGEDNKGKRNDRVGSKEGERYGQHARHSRRY